MDLIYLTKVAIAAAESAAKIIQSYIHKDVVIEKKNAGSSDASQVITEVDRECEKVIVAHLLSTCEERGIALLSEEKADDGSRHEKDFFWCIDPMDGTLAFVNKRPGYAVSIALVAKDGTPYIGVVCDPVTETLYHAIKDHGAYKNGNPWLMENTNNHLSYITDRKLRDTPHSGNIELFLDEKMAQLNLDSIHEISGAGAVMNAILVIENGPACMLKYPKEEVGGGSLWDYAATACIFHELGLRATNYNGGKLDLNRSGSTFMNHEGVFFSNL